MFGFFDTLFNWFNRDEDEESDTRNSEPIDIFADQKKVQFNFMTERDRKSLHQYVTRETQTEISIRRETRSCEVMTDKVDFPLSSFDTEPTKRKSDKIKKHFKYGPQAPIKMNENFKLEFTFHNKGNEMTFLKSQKSNTNSNNYEQKTLESNSKTETENQSETDNNPEKDNQSETNNQSDTDNQSETNNQTESDDHPETDNQSETNNQTEYDANSGYENSTEVEEEEEEAEYD